MPGNVLISIEVERSIAALDPDHLPENAGLVALARLYALTLHESGPTQNALKEIGPKLTATLTALGAGKRSASAPLPLPVPAPAEHVPTAIEAARAEPGSPGDELAIARERAARARAARSS